VRSQLDQFHRFLTARNLLADDRLKLDPPRLDTFARLAASNDHLRSILATLNSLDALDRIAPIFAGLEDDPFRRHHGDLQLSAALGLNGAEEVSRAQAVAAKPALGVESGNSIALNSDHGCYDKLVGPLWISRQGLLDATDADAPPYSRIWLGGLSATFSDSVLTATGQDTTVSFNLAAAIKPDAPVAKSPLLIPANEGRDHATLILVEPPKSADPNRVRKFQVWLLFNQPSSAAAAGPFKSPSPSH
jgi:hypothetical protein